MKTTSFQSSFSIKLTPLGQKLVSELKKEYFRDRYLPSSKEMTKTHGVYKETFPSSPVDRKISYLIYRSQEYWMRAPIRKQVTKALTLPGGANVNTQKWPGTYVYLKGFSELSECNCIIPFTRSVLGDDARQMIVLMLLTHAMQIKPKMPLRIASIGSGHLLNELFMLAAFSKNHITDLQLDCVDIDNRDDTTYLYSDAIEHKKKLIKQFLTILHYGLGFNIEANKLSKTIPDSCKIMNEKTYLFSKNLKETSYGTPNGILKIAFFGSTQEYANQLNKNNKPNLVYDIDLESKTENHSAIVNPVKAKLESGTFWFSSYKNHRLRGLYGDATTDVLRKNKNGNFESKMTFHHFGK